MAKKSDSTSEEVYADPQTPRVLYSRQMEAVARLATEAGKDAPLIESVEELSRRIEMDIPEILKKKYRDRVYKWDSWNDASGLVRYGGHYELVTRTNHEDLPDTLFELGTGLIIYKRDHFLTFTRRENIEMKQKKILYDFNLKHDRLTNQNARPHRDERGREQALVEQVYESSGRDVGELTPADEIYDYEA